MIVVYLLLLSYAILCVAMWAAWQRMDFVPNVRPNPLMPPFFSVVIPVRNEAENIVNLLQCIESQSIEKVFFEVIIVNDASEDETLSLVNAFQKQTAMTLKIIDLPVIENNTSPKKRAIAEALKIADGNWIVTTDGDCQMGVDWLTTLRSFINHRDAVFVSAPVTFAEKKRGNFLEKLWNQIQAVEFGSLIGAGAVSMQTGHPNMCSGANIAYRKDAFFAVNGFAGNEQLASGDDEFLLHKMQAAFPGKIHYLKHPAAIVTTQAQPSLAAFVRQRRRWASKWRFYSDWRPTALAVYVAVVNGLAAYAMLTGQWTAVFLKFSGEFIYLLSVNRFLSGKNRPGIILLTQIIYPFYIVFFAILAQFPSTYRWKDRKLR